MARFKSHLFADCGPKEITVAILGYTILTAILLAIGLVLIKLLYPSHNIPCSIFSYSMTLAIANSTTIIISGLIVDVVDFCVDKLASKDNYSPYDEYADNPYDWLLDKY